MTHHDDFEADLQRDAEAGDPTTMNYLGDLMEERGNFAEAKTWYRRAANTRDERDVNYAMTKLGRLLRDNGEFDEAETWYRRSANNGSEHAMTNLGILLRQRGDIIQAETWYRRAANAGYTFAISCLGDLLRDNGELDEAETWYRRAANLGVDYAMGRLGDLLRDNGELDEAETWYRRAANLGVDYAMGRLGDLLRDNGELDEAETWYRRQLTATGTNGSQFAMISLGKLCQERGDIAQAEAWYRRAADARQSDPMYAVGRELEMRGDFSEAEVWYRCAADARQSDPMYAVGRELEMRGDFSEAEVWYRRAADAGHSGARGALDLLVRGNQAQLSEPSMSDRLGSRQHDQIMVRNWWGFGDGRPVILEPSPDLRRMVDDSNPVLPQTSSGAPAREILSGPDGARAVLVTVYLYHPDPQVRVTAVSLGLDRCPRAGGFENGLVDLAADPTPAVHRAAVRALWSVQRGSNCEYAVKVLGDEIRGHSNSVFGPTKEGLHIGGQSARWALDRMVEQAPDDAAREALRALITKHLVIPERVPNTSTEEVVFVEETHRIIEGARATYHVYRAPGRDEAITFLTSYPVDADLFYIEVETPDATYGRDIKGIYQI